MSTSRASADLVQAVQPGPNVCGGCSRGVWLFSYVEDGERRYMILHPEPVDSGGLVALDGDGRLVLDRDRLLGPPRWKRHVCVRRVRPASTELRHAMRQQWRCRCGAPIWAPYITGVDSATRLDLEEDPEGEVVLREDDDRLIFDSQWRLDGRRFARHICPDEPRSTP